MVLSGSIPPRGIGCFLAGDEQGPGRATSTQFLEQQARINARADFDATHARAADTRAVRRRPPRLSRSPAGRHGRDSRRHLELSIEMRTRECGFYDSTPPARGSATISTSGSSADRWRFKRFAIDETPVTNAQFAGSSRPAATGRSTAKTS